MKGELHSVYYIPDIRHRLISVGRLYSQGWEPRLSRNGFTLYDTKERLISRATLKNGVYAPTLHPDFSLVAGEVDAGVPDEELHERLEHEDEHPMSEFSIGRNRTRSLYTIGTGGWDTAAGRLSSTWQTAQ